MMKKDNEEIILYFISRNKKICRNKLVELCNYCLVSKKFTLNYLQEQKKLRKLQEVNGICSISEII